jgi:hypothetical protein
MPLVYAVKRTAPPAALIFFSACRFQRASEFVNESLFDEYCMSIGLLVWEFLRTSLLKNFALTTRGMDGKCPLPSTLK